MQGFIRTDPLFKSYPYYTPYQFAGNTPIAAIDLDGLEQKLSYVQKQEYKPVFTTDAGDLGTRTANAVTNGLKLINNTVANLTNFVVGTNNTAIDITAGHYNNVSGTVILAEFGQVSAEATDKTLNYLYNTPINEIGADIGKSFIDGMTDIENWEAALELAIAKKLYTPKPKVTPLGKTWTPNELGDLGENALRRTFGGSKPSAMQTPFGKRFIDNLAKNSQGQTVAYESKVGYKSATEFIRKQVAKDQFLLQTKQVDEVRWIFYRSPATGKAGASQPLLDILEDAGIKTEIRELPKKTAGQVRS